MTVVRALRSAGFAVASVNGYNPVLPKSHPIWQCLWRIVNVSFSPSFSVEFLASASSLRFRPAVAWNLFEI